MSLEINCLKAATSCSFSRRKMHSFTGATNVFLIQGRERGGGAGRGEPHGDINARRKMIMALILLDARLSLAWRGPWGIAKRPIIRMHIDR